MAKDSSKAGNTAGIIATLVGIAFGKVLGLSLFIPIIFAALAHFGATQITKRMEANGRRIGGFGPTDSSTAPFKLAVSVETGHLLWGALGLGLALTNALSNTEIELTISNYVEFCVYLILFLTFCLRPRWWTAALLIGYHCITLIHIPMLMEELNEFSKETRSSLERGYISHMIFHSLAVCTISWYSLARVKIGDAHFVFWKALRAEAAQPTPHFQPISERLSQLADLHKKGLISDADLEVKKLEILKDL